MRYPAIIDPMRTSSGVTQRVYALLQVLWYRVYQRFQHLSADDPASVRISSFRIASSVAL
jgi:hypothetical protein